MVASMVLRNIIKCSGQTSFFILAYAIGTICLLKIKQCQVKNSFRKMVITLLYSRLMAEELSS